MEFNEVDYARSVFDQEIEELTKVRDHLNSSIRDVANLILKSKGKVVVTGIGKSGLIGKKIAATLASTGTHAIFMNSAEGLHGDLGMICPEDVVLAISNSGNSDEIVSLLPSIEKIGASVVAMTGNKTSKLGRAADYILDIGVTKEGCPINLAPMSSTTSTLVMGDALAAILIKRRDFKPENFAVYHPGGSLGKRLLMKVKDIMKKGEDLPLCDKESPINDVIMIMTEKSLGAVCVMNSDIMVGIITEGDIRRALARKEEFFNLKAKDIMTRNYTRTDEDSMAIDALALMEDRKSQISVLPVMKDLKLVGIVRVHDLLNVVGR
ncbi:Arabinose 5-phosphate isomerase KdsD [Fusobacterium sp. DD29]|uniref:KpsF/GutQ family sugar-phosphate isomerase n=1 Tax=unclassified Fusobacterium TaxID=2648384 RepID=UPI001B8C375F|nr:MULTISPECIES: KpsF/GutQ family sugar-phosphate isomerase [unclassified Fusobacterium]MBR8700204.1 Arabinose 5-phosphate isomerase KdsD [Fusobacterium sp. DD45]MBR8710345.1 Arabinose 5-phosphate isomerase KdsD [Fusobacterium sp. DD28]MBR8748793.1 Arabinose 5-phosphate isomerase KdsD [Fusobacterium sp. DD29]MBR8750926.1 Arabinose 5-phosphate isomerase KdsD [Fusobacterium sp. DD26]MBR8761050.1 Arabinose 5-phosphate isomerase KdsD [Fusobacterium sp. DD25]